MDAAALAVLAAAAVVLAAGWAWRRRGARRRATQAGGSSEPAEVAAAHRTVEVGDSAAPKRSAEVPNETVPYARTDDPGAWAWYYKRRPWLLTLREKAFADRLRRALDDAGLDDWRVSVQVALSALVDRRSDRADRQGIPGWRLDYVVADAQWSVQGAIELNDSSHAGDKRRWRDERLAAGLERLKIPLLVLEDGDADDLEAWLDDLIRRRAERLAKRGRATGAGHRGDGPPR